MTAPCPILRLTVRNDLSKRCRNDVDVAKMLISVPLLRLFRHNCGEIDILVTSTPFRHLFDKNHFSLAKERMRATVTPRRLFQMDQNNRKQLTGRGRVGRVTCPVTVYTYTACTAKNFVVNLRQICR